MNTLVPAERVFSFSCFEGLRLLRWYGDRHPGLATMELLNVILQMEADASGLDMEAAIELASFIEPGCPLNGHAFYQSCIEAFIIQYRPNWLQSMCQGRARFLRQLKPDVHDVFRAAGLSVEPVSTEIVSWWDAISGQARQVGDHLKVIQGREAEMLTLDHERRELAASGIELEPEWPGLDDNFAGYDVLSYQKSCSGITNRLIEVKSTMVSPLRFIVTQNEWLTAEEADKAYIFHVWDMQTSPPTLHTRTVQDVKPHIPSNNGKGKWKNAIIPLGAG